MTERSGAGSYDSFDLPHPIILSVQGHSNFHPSYIHQFSCVVEPTFRSLARELKMRRRPSIRRPITGWESKPTFSAMSAPGVLGRLKWWGPFYSVSTPLTLPSLRLGIL
jgi:hypothetical protein